MHKFWTEEENDFLRENIQKMSITEMVQKLNRTKSSVQTHMSEIDVYKRQWNQNDVNFLRNNFGKLSMREIAIHLKMNRKRVYTKANRMGLTKWSKDDKRFNLNSQELSYLAGLIDGEGSIFLSFHRCKHQKDYYEPHFRITNCSVLFRDYAIKNNFRFVTRKRKGNFQIKYDICFYGFRMKWFLESLIPYLVLKKSQAIIMTEYIDERMKMGFRSWKETKKMQELRKILSLLNSKQRQELYSLERKIIEDYSLSIKNKIKGGEIYGKS